jgi:hypothetical protein
MTLLSRIARLSIAAAAVAGFNIVMMVLAAMSQAPIDTPFVFAWIGGDFALSLIALALTERSS